MRNHFQRKDARTLGRKAKTRFLFATLLLCALALSLFVLPTAAQNLVPDAFPTVTALHSAVIPVRDRTDLARRFLGVVDVAPPPTSAPLRTPGETESFWIMNPSQNRNFQVNATLQAVGEHIYLWVEEGVSVDSAELNALAAAFDQRIYPNVRALWGSEAIPGIDGDPRVYGLFAHNVGPGVAAYFASEHINPVEVVSTSNEHEMFFFNLDALGTLNIDRSDVEGIVAHEFQHMIRRNVDDNEDTWLDEGFSEFTAVHFGYTYSVGAALSFLSVPGTQLNTWSESQPRTPHYGAAMLFTTYFYQRYGDEGIALLSADPANGMVSVENTLQQLGQPELDALFGDWVLANFLTNPNIEDGRYGYSTLPWALPAPFVRSTVTTYPYQDANNANQYSATYYVLSNLQGIDELRIRVDSPAVVPLVPTAAHSGQRMWYSNRGDNSDMRLTRAFDLSGVESATLTYAVWHHFERFWDYGYVAVSTDGGATWETLESAHTTNENPQNNAYGAGYTGVSEGWFEETISLDEYVGGEVLIRFEVITDDSITQPGMVIDDVSIPEIGYHSDFETDDGGWQPEGWLITDNVLPQGGWVQAVQQFGADRIELSRWALNEGANEWTLTLSEGVDQVALVVSPFAPVTTVPMSYTLTVE